MKIKIPDRFTTIFVPSLEATRHFEYFLISAVFSLLGIRFYLALTGYPQLGGGNFHIAHMLWGGLFMLIAIIILISYINAESKVIAVVLAGIGFGTFIDELGKFITADNNYFYQPTIALIYLIFVSIYLVSKWFSEVAVYSSKTYVANAVEGFKEFVILDLDEEEKNKTLAYLALADKNDPTVKLLTDLIQKARPNKKEFSVYLYIKNKTLKWYRNAIFAKWVSRGLIFYFILNSFFNVFSSAGIAYSSDEYAVIYTGYFLSSVFMAVLVAIGIYFYFKKENIKFYFYFHKAALVGIFLIQFFIFLQNELMGITSLIFYITVYLIINYSIEGENQRVYVGKK